MRQHSHTADLWQYVVFLDERISRARKQGKDISLLQQNRQTALRTITTLKQPAPTINKDIEALTGQI